MNYQQQTAMHWGIVALMALLAIASFLAAFYHRQAGARIERSDWGRRHLQTNDTLRCNGLSSLCDVAANEIVYATVHNANTALVSGSILKNHVRHVRQALVAGYRGINFDIGKCFGKVRLVHGTCLSTSTNLKRMLRHLVTFLDDNPHEVLILPTELTQPIFEVSDSASLTEIAAVFASVPGWNERLYQHPGPGQPWPTLRQLIAADTRVLFFHYNGETCGTNGTIACPFGFHPWFRYAAETQFSFPTVADLDATATACQITRGGSGTRDFFGVNLFVTPPRIGAAARVTNTATFVRRHVAACAQLQDLGVNLILVNFWDIGDVLEVVNEMNAALPPSLLNASSRRRKRTLYKALD